jgi:transposase-like protein
MGTRVSYPVDVKMKCIEMKLAGSKNKDIMRELNIRNVSQIRTWMRWFRANKLERLSQPVGKQYSYGKGPEYASEVDQLRAENRFMQQQIEVLKKYKELERRCDEKSCWK